jgi:hypothetical protein
VFDKSDVGVLFVTWGLGFLSAAAYIFWGVWFSVAFTVLTLIAIVGWGKVRIQNEAMVSAAQFADGMFKDLAKNLKKGDFN